MDRRSRVVALSHPFRRTIFSNYLTQNRPAGGGPHNVLSKNTTGSSMLYRGRPIQISVHSDPRNFVSVGASAFLTWVYAHTKSLPCPAHPGSLAITSRFFEAVICDVDEYLSVNAECEPESSFTTSLQSITRPLYFWNCCLNSEFLKWHKSISVPK